MPGSRKNELQLIIDHLIPIKNKDVLSRTGRQFVHFEVDRIKSNPVNKNFSLCHQDKSVSKITFIMPIESKSDLSDGRVAIVFDLNCYVMITTENAMKVYSLPDEYYAKFAPHLNVLIKLYNGLVEQAFLDLRSPITTSTPLHYTDPIHAFYSKIRPLVARSISNELKREAVKSVLIVSLGSGAGHDLRECRTLLTEENPAITTTFIGYDSCQILIEAANNESTKLDEKNVSFVEANCKSLEKFTSGESEHNIGIAVGFSTRQVLAGTYESLPIYQRAYRQFDCFINTGITAPLITLDIANAIGWTPFLRNFMVEDDYPSQMFSLYILKKNKVLNVVDRINTETRMFNLAMSAVPLEHLQTLIRNHPNQLNTITSIDLSFAYFLPEEMTLFLNQLSALKNLKVVCHDPDDRWTSDFKRVALCEESKSRMKYELKSLNLRKECPQELPFYSRKAQAALQSASISLTLDRWSYFGLSDLRSISLVSKACDANVKEPLKELRNLTCR